MTGKADLTGISAQSCPYDCGPEGCVITGSICGHPFKGGLQGALQSKPDVVANYQAARKMLHGQKLNLTSEQEDDGSAPKAKQKKNRPAKPRAKPAAASAGATPPT
jgi:hypothetical protein